MRFVPSQIPRGVARRTTAPAIVVLAWLAFVCAPVPASAARYRIDSRTGVLAYPVIGRDGAVVLDERIVQTRLRLQVDDLLEVPADSLDPAREPDVALGASLRWFANPGVAGNATDPANLRFVPLAQDMALEILWAHVAATNLFGGWLDLRAGRVLHDGPLGWRSDDGAELRFGPFEWLGVTVAGGFENVRGLRLSGSPFAPEGVERWSADGEGAERYDGNVAPEHRPTVQATLDGRAGPVGYAAAYRRTWRSVDGRPAEELLGFELDGGWGPLSAFGTTRVDLTAGLVADAAAELAARLGGGRHRLEARYEYFRPTFDAESIFWVFAADPFHEATLRYGFPLVGALRGETWLSARHVQGPGGAAAPTTLLGPFTDLGGGVGLTLRTEAFTSSLRWKLLRGATTDLAGADWTVRVPLATRWELFAVASGWQWDDLLREGGYGVGGAGRAGAAVELVDGVRVEAEAQVAHDTREGTTFAVFAWLDLGVAW